MATYSAQFNTRWHTRTHKHHSIAWLYEWMNENENWMAKTYNKTFSKNGYWITFYYYTFDYFQCIHALCSENWQWNGNFIWQIKIWKVLLKRGKLCRIVMKNGFRFCGDKMEFKWGNLIDLVVFCRSFYCSTSRCYEIPNMRKNLSSILIHIYSHGYCLQMSVQW